MTPKEFLKQNSLPHYFSGETINEEGDYMSIKNVLLFARMCCEEQKKLCLSSAEVKKLDNYGNKMKSEQILFTENNSYEVDADSITIDCINFIDLE